MEAKEKVRKQFNKLKNVKVSIIWKSKKRNQHPNSCKPDFFLSSFQKQFRDDCFEVFTVSARAFKKNILLKPEETGRLSDFIKTGFISQFYLLS